jgi:glycosyltransferase involved in cell wall biosynthesis
LKGSYTLKSEIRPLVSIITPSYNRGHLISNAIASVISQTFPNWEHIIVDDGSGDNTDEVVASFKDPRLIYIYQTHSGQAVARNRALDMARGEWIAYIDSDNELFPRYLEIVLRRIEENPGALFVIPGAVRSLELYDQGLLVDTIDESNNLPDNLAARDIGLRTFHFDTNGFMHSRIIFQQGIKFDEGMHRLEDWDFAIEIAEKYPNHFLCINDVLVHYHQRYGTDGLVSNTSYGEWADLFEYIYQKHKDKQILQEQTWYPDRVLKFRNLQLAYENGDELPPHLRQFRKRET